MSAKQCLWSKFRAKCEFPRDCLESGVMPDSCLFCGWDCDTEWEDCLKQLSPNARTVEEILHEEDPDEIYKPL